MLDIKFHRIENPNHHVRSFVEVNTLNGTDKGIIHTIFPRTYSKDLLS